MGDKIIRELKPKTKRTMLPTCRSGMAIAEEERNMMRKIVTSMRSTEESEMGTIERRKRGTEEPPRQGKVGLGVQAIAGSLPN